MLTRQDEEAYKSFRNLPEVQLILTGELNAYDVLCSDWIVFTAETLPGGSTAAAPSESGISGQSAADSEATVDAGTEAVDEAEPATEVEEPEAEEAGE